MRTLHRFIDPRLLGWAGLVLVVAGLLLAGCQGDEIQSLPEGQPGTFIGARTNVPVSYVTDGGWQLCHSETYATTTSDLATVLAGCPGASLMMACRVTGSNVLTAAAYAAKADVTFVTPVDATTTHAANDASWYYNDTMSWGFAALGDSVYKSSCDYEPSAASQHPEKKLCWHLTSPTIGDGWRCGSTESLNSATNWEKLLFTR